MKTGFLKLENASRNSSKEKKIFGNNKQFLESKVSEIIKIYKGPQKLEVLEKKK